MSLYPVLCILAVLAIVVAKIASKPTRRAKIAKIMGRMNPMSRSSAATVPGPAPAADQPPHLGWSILIVLVGAGLAIWGFVAQVRPADIGSLSWKYWLPLLIVWGTLSALIALNVKALGGAAKVLQTVLAVVVVVALVVLPIWHGIESSSAEKEAKSTRSEIPLTSSPRSTWLKLVIPAGVGSKSERITVPPSMRTRTEGDKFRLLIIYHDGEECILPDQVCPAKSQAAVRAINDSKYENIIAYAFFP